MEKVRFLVCLICRSLRSQWLVKRGTLDNFINLSYFSYFGILYICNQIIKHLIVIPIKLFLYYKYISHRVKILEIHTFNSFEYSIDLRDSTALFPIDPL